MLHTPALSKDARWTSGNTAWALGQSLTTDEKRRLAAYEHRIEFGLASFLDVAEALVAVRAEKLYREKFSTFEEYCRAKFDMTSRRARQIMEGAEVVHNIKRLAPVASNGNKSSTTPVLPRNEGQVRPLAGLPPKAQAEVWQAVAAKAPNGKVTGKAVQAAVEERKNPASASERQRASTDTKPVVVDMTKEFYRISRKNDQSRWQIKEAPGWRIAAMVETLAEAWKWITERGHHPINVPVTDSGTWKSLHHWHTLGTEPGQKKNPADLSAGILRDVKKVDIKSVAEKAVAALQRLRALMALAGDKKWPESIDCALVKLRLLVKENS